MRSNNQNITDTGLNAGQTDSLRNASVHPPASAWPKIQQSVRRKSRMIFLYRAAAVVALSGVILFVLQLSNSDPAQVQPQVATRSIEKTDNLSAPVIRKETTEAVMAGPVAVRPKPSPDVPATVVPPQSRLDEQALAEDTSLPEKVTESTAELDIVQTHETTSAASGEEASEAIAEAPITIVYELPAPEYESSRRQVTVSRIFGFAADLKSGQANLGLFRSIRQVLSEPARRFHQQNTNLQ